MRDFSALLKTLEGKIESLLEAIEKGESKGKEKEFLFIKQEEEICLIKTKNLELEKALKEKEDELAFLQLMLEEAISNLERKHLLLSRCAPQELGLGIIPTQISSPGA
jgi:tRNA U34 5-carboxymethylaminomethyl modifying GTPase MnmE/TrmE